jgi:hypothetical protein
MQNIGEKNMNHIIKQRKEVVRTFQEHTNSTVPNDVQIYRLAEFSNSFFNNGTILHSYRTKIINDISDGVKLKEKKDIRFNESICKILLNALSDAEKSMQPKQTPPTRSVTFHEKYDTPRTSPPVIPDQRVTNLENRANFKFSMKTSADKGSSRIEFRLNMKPKNTDTNSVYQLQRQLQELVNELLGSDKSLRFLPWYNNIEQTPLPHNKIPNDIRLINRYFQRVRPKEVGFTYGEFKIRHKKKWENIIYDLTPLLTETKHGMYYQKVQCQNTANIGWLLWSFRRIDPVALETEIKNLYGVTVQLRFQNIPTGNPNEPEENTVRALHMIVDRQDEDKISMLFQTIYNFYATHFPLGIILRFVPQLRRVSKDKQPRVQKWRYKQKVFSAAIENVERPMSTTNWEILQLDKIINGFGTLRKVLMTIPIKGNSSESLFLSVDTSFFRSNEVIFTFLPKNESEARLFVSNIVPFFHHQYDEPIIKQLFHEEAITRAANSIWNADTNEVVSSVDMYVDQSCDICDNFELPEMIGNTTPIKLSYAQVIKDNEIHRIQRIFTGDDATSVGTMYTMRDGIRTPMSEGYNNYPTTATTADVTNTYTSSITNMNAEAETKLQVMSDEISSLKAMIYALIQNSNVTQNQIPQTSMQLDVNNGDQIQKRKAGDSNESACQAT